MARNIFFSILLLISILPFSFVCSQQRKTALDYVNTLIGTPAKGDGGTMPCVGPPFAMTNFTAQTRENKMKAMPYVYEDSFIQGFTATHQPTVWMGDYGYVSVMPQMGRLKVLPGQRQMHFDHADEIARPHYYAVKMQDSAGKNIRAEMAATGKCGILRFGFADSGLAHLIIQAINVNPAQDDEQNKSDKRKLLRGYIYLDTAAREIRGYNPDRIAMNLGPALPAFKGYFVIRFDQQPVGFGTWNGDTIFNNSLEQYGSRAGAFLSFGVKKAGVLTVKIATSFISTEQAVQNMAMELPGWQLEDAVKQTGAKWQENLGRIQLKGATEDQKAIFYTAMFHTMLFPREFSESGRYYSAFDDKVHTGISYNDYSLWDTYRALHPLLIFTQPERVNGMIASMLQMYREGGWLPMWPNPAETNIMIGTHADAVIADAYVKGFKGYDTLLAYEAMLKNATVPPDRDTLRWGYDREEWAGFEGRIGLSYYHSLGYVPADRAAESVSRTVEYGIDDYCIARVAQLLGHKAQAGTLMKWSRNYKNLYRPQTGFLYPRLYNGLWGGDEKLSFTEGSRWTYAFGAVQDIPGMIKLMGGNKAFAKKLDQNFAEGHYAHDNEPGHHYIYLYNYCGQPWKAQALVRKHVNTNYFNKPQGINGNDDCGQMSAWYIFSTMGFYPVTPASGVYALGAPQVPEVTLHFTSGGAQKKLVIRAKNISEKNKYVASVTFNGKPIKNFIGHTSLVQGGLLQFEMTGIPVKDN